ncbi:hemolysin-III related-domain-containing protein [Mycena floridula]|nr:hemolysin-III related-domain-containing protein [Mycena floridula]
MEPLSKTISWQVLEEFQRDNEFIVNGYRRAQYRWKGCFISIFAYLHNETVNIHSHLWGALLFLYFAFYTYMEPYPAWKDTALLEVFLFAAATCLSFSALFHTSTCHSKEVSDAFHSFDYAGIVILIVGSFYPSLYYGFFFAAYLVLDPEYAKPSHRGARTTVFVFLGLSAVIPVSHIWISVSAIDVLWAMGVHWLLLSGSLYIIGALLYANRIPERFAPGTFDFFFASHQIFHVCVVLAALAHYVSVLKALEYSHTLQCKPPA